jgi:glycosyltransferase A (GT-A) superfamily protein (DUF2064 family)
MAAILARVLAMTALAIFVKTPGLSPVKTRLAAGIGVAKAEHFYRLAVEAVAEVAAASIPSLVPYWAVAERAAMDDPMWSGFDRISQGEGGLGDRLDHVYARLLARHGSVLLIGADSPQITARGLADAAGAAHPFAMGRAEDGGFWLFGGDRPINGAVWRAVPYSASDTADRLVARLEGVTFVETLRDVDEAGDLVALRTALAGLAAPVPAQAALAAWLDGIASDGGDR